MNRLVSGVLPALAEVPAWGQSLCELARASLSRGGASAAMARLHLPFLTVTVLSEARGHIEHCRRSLVDDPIRYGDHSTELALLVAEFLRYPALVPVLWQVPPFTPEDYVQNLSRAGLNGSFDSNTRLYEFYSASLSAGEVALLGPCPLSPSELDFPLMKFLHWAYAAQGRQLVRAGSLGGAGAGCFWQAVPARARRMPSWAASWTG